MKKSFLIILIFLSIFSGCKKTETPRTSGTDTIDNTLYGSGPYYENGFSFSQAKKVSSLDDPGPDILIYVNIDNSIPRLTLQANNLKPSFYLAGQYNDDATASSGFINLKTVAVSQWLDMADPIAANQVWIYRTGRDQYVKFRIISIINEVRNNLPYGECTFEWLFQPDGSLTFPGK